VDRFTSNQDQNKEAQLSPREHASAAHYTGGQVNELSAVGHYKIHRYEIFACEKYLDLETRVSGHVRSLAMAPFNRSYMTFY